MTGHIAMEIAGRDVTDTERFAAFALATSVSAAVMGKSAMDAMLVTGMTIRSFTKTTSYDPTDHRLLGPRTRRTHPDTSHQAAERIAAHVTKQARQVFDWLTLYQAKTGQYPTSAELAAYWRSGEKDLRPMIGRRTVRFGAKQLR